MLVFAGTLHSIWGIAAIDDSAYLTDEGRFVIFDDLNTWGWFLLIVGVLQVVAATSIRTRRTYGPIFGIACAILHVPGWSPSTRSRLLDRDAITRRSSTPCPVVRLLGIVQGQARRRRGSAGRHPEGKLSELFDEHQRAFCAEHAPEGVGFDDLSVLGPVLVVKLKFSPEGYEHRLVAELWLYPDGTRILERSTNAREARAHVQICPGCAELGRRRRFRWRPGSSSTCSTSSCSSSACSRAPLDETGTEFQANDIGRKENKWPSNPTPRSLTCSGG